MLELNNVPDKLEGKKVVLKKHEVSFNFANTIFNVINKNKEIMAPWFPWFGMTKRAEECYDYLKRCEKKWDAKIKFDYGLYLKEGDKFIGICGLINIDQKARKAEIGYWMDGDYCGCGYMREAVTLIENEFFNRGLNKISIMCGEDNIRSANLAAKSGYVFEGKSREDIWSKFQNKFKDSITYSKLKSEWLVKKDI